MDLKGKWNHWVGSPTDTRLTHRTFNVIMLLTASILAFMAPLNLLMGFLWLSICWAVLGIVVLFVFYIVRFKKRFALGLYIYAAAGYLVMTLSYFLNSGSYGPTPILMCLFLMLLVVISPPRMHLFWVIAHGAFITAAFIVEYLHPELVPNTYGGEFHRAADMWLSTVPMFFFTYIILKIYIGGYRKERAVANQLAKDVDYRNQELGALNVKKDKLLSIIAHDMRSPLNSIQGYYELIRSKEESISLNDRERLEEKLTEMISGTLTMLDNLVYWSRSQMESNRLTCVSVNLAEVAHEVLQLERTIAHRKSITIGLTVDEKCECALGDRGMIVLVLRNLIGNAIKFTPEGGSIHVFCRVIDGRSCMSVTDNGIGIQKDRIHGLFSVQSVTTYGTNHEKGTGLGLSLCQEMIEAMGGSITVESTEGKGSSFTFCLPQGNVPANLIPQLEPITH